MLSKFLDIKIKNKEGETVLLPKISPEDDLKVTLADLNIESMAIRPGFENDEGWKNLCCESFTIAKQELGRHSKVPISAASIAQISDDEELMRFEVIDEKLNLRRDRLNSLRGSHFLHSNQFSDTIIFQNIKNDTILADYDPKTFTFKHLFLKLLFEEMLQHL